MVPWREIYSVMSTIYNKIDVAYRSELDKSNACKSEKVSTKEILLSKEIEGIPYVIYLLSFKLVGEEEYRYLHEELATLDKDENLIMDNVTEITFSGETKIPMERIDLWKKEFENHEYSKDKIQHKSTCHLPCRGMPQLAQ